MNIIKNLAVAALLTTSLSCAMASGLADTDFSVAQDATAKKVSVVLPASALLAATDVSTLNPVNQNAVAVGRAVLAQLEAINKTLHDEIVIELNKDVTKKFDISAFFRADKDLDDRIQTNTKRLDGIVAQADALKGLFGLESAYDRMVRLGKIKEIDDLRAMHPHRSSPLAFDTKTGSRLKNTKKTFGKPYDHTAEGFDESQADAEIAKLKMLQKGPVDSSDHTALSAELKSQLKATRLAAHAEIERLNKAPKGMDAAAAQKLVIDAKFSPAEVKKGLGADPVTAEDWLNGALRFASKAVDVSNDLEVDLAEALDKLSKAPTSSAPTVVHVQTPGTYTKDQVDALFAKHASAVSVGDAGLPLLSTGGLDHAELAKLFTTSAPSRSRSGSFDEASADRTASPVSGNFYASFAEAKAAGLSGGELKNWATTVRR